MKPSEIFIKTLKENFSECIDKDIDLLEDIVTFSCNDYKIVIEKNGIGFNLNIYDRQGKNRYISLLNTITAFSMSKKFGLERIYSNQFKDLKTNLEKIQYEDYILDMFKNDKIDDINKEYKKSKQDRQKSYIIKKYANEFGYKFNFKTETFDEEIENG